jgi:hypothetical protein
MPEISGRKMKRNKFARYVAATTLLLPFAFTGCGGADSTAQNPTASADTPNQAQTSTTEDARGTDCAQSVAIFLDSLRRGDERAANAVITSKAREELAKCAFGLQPLGSPEGKFEIGRVYFPYQDNADVALVECTWVDPPQQGETPTPMDIVCEVHKENDGWHISGMGVTESGGEEAILLDFEDAVSLQATLTGTTPNASPASQATSMAAQSTNGLPELPSFPAPQDTSYENAGPSQQIALPPLNNAPINR